MCYKFAKPKRVGGLKFRYRDKQRGFYCLLDFREYRGGAGVLESLAYEVAEKPNLIFDALDAVISPSDLEQTDIALSKIVKLSVQDPEVQGLVKNLRRSSSLNYEEEIT